MFGASNFPLAYSVPGGDTAAALTAGCPVVIKAHPAHPGASEMCGAALTRAARTAGLPDDWISVLQGRGTEVGGAIVLAPEIRAVGFTGSLTGGRAHCTTSRPPGTIPSRCTPRWQHQPGRGHPRGSGRADRRDRQSVRRLDDHRRRAVLCTKPGLMFVPDDEATNTLIAEVRRAVDGVEPAMLVSERVRDTLSSQVERTSALAGVKTIARGRPPENGSVCHTPVALVTDIETFLASPELHDEHFGPCSLPVCYRDDGTLLTALEGLTSSLTATMQVEPDELEGIADVQRCLVERAGRLVFNGLPTGLAVTHATHHGGPHPATTDVLHTSVGATALRRFLRPVCYQDAPQEVLPAALQDDNPLGIPRRIDRRWTDAPVWG